ncbi:Leptomycin B resistance protein pmd1 [Tolypocladium paradoxum]|uniref:Leptomycin B resistance protein pmd1 n=1 Tax=Tolypocladium paradoxum TaxID=94208 RepID=A0A2S4KVW7_9HYPO|nr:Leptomycin B resistance protein pmd1 [Tolypocladium paradoxum]
MAREHAGTPPAADGTAESTASEGVEPDKDMASSFKYFARVFTYNDATGWFMNGAAVVCMVAAGTALPLMDIVFGQFINVFNAFVRGELSPDGYVREVGRYTLYFVYLFVAKFALTYVWTVLINITAIRTTRRLRVDFVRQTLRQEISFFDTPSSSLSGQITTNGNLVNNGISEKLGLTVQAVSSFVTAFVVAFAVQWKLTLIVLAIVPLNVIVTVVCVVKDTALEYRMFDIYSQSGSLAEEAFSTIRTAHAFWAFPKLAARFDAILEAARRVGRRKSLLYAVLFPVEFFCVIAGYALAFWQGVRMYASGEIPQPGTVVTVIFAVLVAAQALTQIAPQTIAISKATAAAQDLFSVIDRKSAVDSLSSEGARIEGFRGDIKLRGVTFSYPARPGVPVLHGLDLDIPANRTTALVGASGSGKSTIFGILERWYPFSGGSVTLDGHGLEDLNLQWLRTNIRLVQQEPTLFSGSIFQNVVDGLTGTDMADVPDADKQRLVRDACKAAYAHDFIEELPNGYETYIGERGASLSGGQKQRIVIARSIISNPRVLLLDEATSALDPNAEKVVQAALNNVARGRTMVVIAHRLSTIRDADNIVVMARGGTVESGTHDELLERGGAYARLVKAQDLGKAEDKTEDDDEDGDADDGAELKDVPVADLDVALTRASTAATTSGPPDDEDDRYGLFHGLYLILKEQKSLHWPMLGIVLCCIAGGGTYPALAVLFSKTMEAFETIDVAKGDFFALMFFVVALANLVAYAIAGWLSNILAQYQTVMKFYRGELFDNTLRQDMAFFDRPENSTGALVSHLAAEPTSLQELLSINIMLLAINLVNLLSSAVLAIAVGWKLGLVLTLGALPVLVGAGYVRIRLEFKFEDDTAGRFAQSSGVAAEAVMGIRTVSSLALERAVVGRYEEQLQGIAGAAIGSLGWKMFFYALSQSVSFLVMGLGFWYGGKLVSTGEYTTAQFYTVFIAVVFSGESAAMLFQYTTSITKARAAINYIFRLRRDRVMQDAERDSEGEGEGDSGEKTAPAGEEATKGTEVVCEAVEFAYPLRPKQKVLRGIDASIRSGKMVALVGASGCGKSTMIALLQRFYDPVAGTLRADGQDIAGLDRCRYRRDMALVQQEPVLYQGSIRDNIALGVEAGDASEADVVAACKSANVWDFVASLPQGLDTPCGAQGLSLSGGQRQRIAIARALIRRPRLLLLDEATSALDTESEKVVKEALDRAAAGRTTVAVAHRLSTVRDADLIAVFAKGRIVERGTHDELLDRRGLYYEMVLGQSLDREAA